MTTDWPRSQVTHAFPLHHRVCLLMASVHAPPRLSLDAQQHWWPSPVHVKAWGAGRRHLKGMMSRARLNCSDMQDDVARFDARACDCCRACPRRWCRVCWVSLRRAPLMQAPSEMLHYGARPTATFTRALLACSSCGRWVPHLPGILWLWHDFFHSLGMYLLFCRQQICIPCSASWQDDIKIS